jgi:hypothetical protein
LDGVTLSRLCEGVDAILLPLASFSKDGSFEVEVVRKYLEKDSTRGHAGHRDQVVAVVIIVVIDVGVGCLRALST